MVKKKVLILIKSNLLFFLLLQLFLVNQETFAALNFFLLCFIYIWVYAQFWMNFCVLFEAGVEVHFPSPWVASYSGIVY
jgi:hypothetical protein